MSGSNFSIALIMLNMHSKVKNAIIMYTLKTINSMTNKAYINYNSSISSLAHVKT